MQPGSNQTPPLAASSALPRSARQRAFGMVRAAHKRLLLKPLPDRVAIYFHDLDRQDYDQFRACIGYFAQQGYRSVPISHYLDPAAAGKMLFVSFDDNYQTWHRALELLDEVGVRAMFYVNTRPFMDVCPEPERLAYFERIAHRRQPVSMTRAELGELVAAGHEIGCHTHSHYNLARLEPDRWDAEIRDCRRQLEDLVGRPIQHFAYPYGMRRYFSAPLRTYCRALGFVSIAAAIPGRLQGARLDPFDLNRTRWDLSQPVEHNVEDVRIDGRLFEALTGYSPVG